MLEEAMHFPTKKAFLESSVNGVMSAAATDTVSTRSNFNEIFVSDSANGIDSTRTLTGSKANSDENLKRSANEPVHGNDGEDEDGESEDEERDEEEEDDDEEGLSTVGYDLESPDSQMLDATDSGHFGIESPKSATTAQPLDGEKRTRKFVCRYCHKAFGLMNVLKVHERIHTGEKPYICEICHKAFNQSGSLNRHKNTHRKRCSDNRSYPCRFCSCEFLHSSHLQEHENTAHFGEIVQLQQAGLPATCMVNERPLETLGSHNSGGVSTSEPDSSPSSNLKRDESAARVNSETTSPNFPLPPLGMKSIQSHYGLPNDIANFPRTASSIATFNGAAASVNSSDSMPPLQPHRNIGMTAGLRCEICAKKFAHRIDLEGHLRQHYLQYAGVVPFPQNTKLPDLPFPENLFLSDPKAAFELLAQIRAEQVSGNGSDLKHRQMHEAASQPPILSRSDAFSPSSKLAQPEVTSSGSGSLRDFPRFDPPPLTPSGPPLGSFNPNSALIAAAMLGANGNIANNHHQQSQLPPLSMGQVLNALVGMVGLGETTKGNPSSSQPGLLPPTEHLLHAVMKLANVPSSNGDLTHNPSTIVSSASSPGRPDLSLSIMNMLAAGSSGIGDVIPKISFSTGAPILPAMISSPNGTSSTKSCCVSPKSGSSLVSSGNYYSDISTRFPELMQQGRSMDSTMSAAHSVAASAACGQITVMDVNEPPRSGRKGHSEEKIGRRRYSPSSSSSMDGKQCIYCDKRFTCSSALRIHFRKHSGERPYKCKFCHKAFSQNGTLKRHYQTCKAANSRGDRGCNSADDLPRRQPNDVNKPAVASSSHERLQLPVKDDLLDMLKTDFLPNSEELLQRMGVPSLLAPLPPQSSLLPASKQIPANFIGSVGGSVGLDPAQLMLEQKIEGTLRKLIFDKIPFPPAPEGLPLLLSEAQPLANAFSQDPNESRFSEAPLHKHTLSDRTVDADEGPEDLSNSRIYSKDCEEDEEQSGSPQAVKDPRAHSVDFRKMSSMSMEHKSSPPTSRCKHSSLTAHDPMVPCNDMSTCETCGIIFRDRGLYDLHKSLHGEGPPGDNFVCSLCGQCLPDAGAFMMHFIEENHTRSLLALDEASRNASANNSFQEPTPTKCQQQLPPRQSSPIPDEKESETIHLTEVNAITTISSINGTRMAIGCKSNVRTSVATEPVPMEHDAGDGVLNRMDIE